MSKEDYNDLKDEQNVDLCDLPEQLVAANMFVPQELDELAILKDFSYKATHREDTLTFTIAITRKCNYRCSYCFEKESLCNESMSLETQQAVVDFIIRKCKEYKGLKTLYLEWFGGEPTLEPQIILNITQGILEYTNKNKIYVSSGIVTNGRLFTNEFVEKIQICNLKHAQITLDGTAKVYAKAKGCTEDDFYKVIENIKAVQDRVNIQIRLNIENNIEDIKRLLLFLSKENLKVTIYHQHIKDMSLDRHLYQQKYQKYVNDIAQLYKFLKEHNLEYLIDKQVTLTFGACPANRKNYYAIDTNGDLFRCSPQLLHHDYALGNIYTDITDVKTDAFYAGNALKGNCENCPYLPYCWGSCAWDRIANKGINCSAIKQFNLMKIRRYLGFNS